MKSIVPTLQGLCGAILDDCVVEFPELSLSIRRDKSRLCKLVDTRGDSVFLLDLPAFGKHFDKCLSEGILTPSGVPCMGSHSRRTSVPRLFSGLMYRIFHESGILLEEPDPNSVFFVRQLCYFAKKFRLECSESRVFLTVEEFADVEQEVRRPSLGWDRSDLLVDSLSPTYHFGDEGVDRLPLFQGISLGSKGDDRLCGHLQSVSDWICSGFGEVRQADLLPKHGPGAVSDLRLPGDKFLFPSWPRKLDRLFPVESFAFSNEGLVDKTWNHDFESSSKLISVPKTQKAPRLIASEPTSYQFIQQALKGLLVKEVRRSVLGHSISFDDQSVNGEWALRGSLNGDLVTVDLSSASDRLSCWAVERFFRKNWSWLNAMHAARTPFLVNTIDKKVPKIFRLKKFSTMGSALTFPVQSICFAIVAIHSVIMTRGWRINKQTLRRASKSVRVFGDDIIVPKDCARVLCRTLSYLGLKVNDSKTHLEGNFRESCGVDAFAGFNVTPAYALCWPSESRPSTVVSTVESSNNFFEKGCWRASAYLRSLVPHQWDRFIPVVPHGSGAFGYRSYVGSDVSRLPRRYNTFLQKDERLCTTLRVKVVKTKSEGWSNLLQYHLEMPSSLTAWESGYGSTPTTSISRRWVAEELLR